MDSVLEAATVFSACKLVCSLPFVRSVVASTSSPVSFCCHCLLVFTDVVITVFFGSLLILQHWQIVEPYTGSTIALRSLLFICHTYGAVFLLTLPEIIVDTLVRQLRQQETNENHNTKQKDPEEIEKRRTLRFHIVAYLCCLSIWIFGTLNIRLRWKMEEVWTAACLYSTNSLLTCLPNIYSPMMRVLPPCWAMALLYIAIAIVICICLLRTRPKTSASPGVDTWMTQKTVQMCADRDVGLSPENAGKTTEHKDRKSTEKVIRLTLTEERKPTTPQSGSSLRAEVMIGVLCVLAMFVLPLHLTVNIHLISAVEKIAERSMRCLGLSRSVTAYDHSNMV